MSGSDTLFSPTYSPAKLKWWHTVIRRYERPGDPDDYGHIGVLRQMLGLDDADPESRDWCSRSVEDTEALDYCYRRVVHERAGHPATGEWCVCLSEDPPSAGDARGSIGGDGMSALIAVKSDLEHAADELPISWQSTERVFEAQGRRKVWDERFLAYRRNQTVREIDRWLEPRDPSTGRPRSTQLSFYLMSVTLGGTRTYCAWPRKAPLELQVAGVLIDRDVFAAHLNGLLELEAA